MNNFETTALGCIVFHHKHFIDSRGSFTELKRFTETGKIQGLPEWFVPKQENLSTSSKDVIRGFHYQTGANAQAKWVRVLSGRALDVVIDIRKGSPTYGKMETFFLTPHGNSVLIPKGMAHGFWSLENGTLFSYVCDSFYDTKSESGIFPLGPHFPLPWFNEPVIISDKDKKLPHFAETESPFVFEA